MVRAKGFLRFEESLSYLVTYQQVGGRIEVRTQSTEAPPPSAGRLCTLVLIGQSLDDAALLRDLRGCESSSSSSSPADADSAGDPAGCELCEVAGPVDDEGGRSSAGTAGAAERAATPPSVGDAFAARVRSDTRFDAESTSVRQGGTLVAFRMLGWLGVGTEELTSQLMEQLNFGAPSGGGGGGGGGGGSSVKTPQAVAAAAITTPAWCLPCREDDGAAVSKLMLLLPLATGSDPAAVWAAVYQAVEVVMMGHFGALFCGGCDCIDKLAGQVLV